MAEILSMDHRLSDEGVGRLADGLTAMIEQGQDPDPRGVQIRSLGLSLPTLVQTLQVEPARLDLVGDLDALTSNLERLARSARAYGADGADRPDKQIGTASHRSPDPHPSNALSSRCRPWASFC